MDIKKESRSKYISSNNSKTRTDSIIKDETIKLSEYFEIELKNCNHQTSIEAIKKFNFLSECNIDEKIRCFTPPGKKRTNHFTQKNDQGNEVANIWGTYKNKYENGMEPNERKKFHIEEFDDYLELKSLFKEISKKLYDGKYNYDFDSIVKLNEDEHILEIIIRFGIMVYSFIFQIAENLWDKTIKSI